MDESKLYKDIQLLTVKKERLETDLKEIELNLSTLEKAYYRLKNL